MKKYLVLTEKNTAFSGYIGTALLILIFLLGMSNAALSADSPTISASPLSVNFGSIKVDGMSLPKVVIIKNTGSTDLTINSITITDGNQAEFIQENNCPVIAAQNSCSINVTFVPRLPFGKKTSIMSISSDDPKKPVINVRLLGQVPPPKISASPISANMGSIPVGAASPPKIVTIKNTGISDLVIDSVAITGTNASEFAQTSECLTVAKGTSCQITVTFTPAVTFGKKTVAISISSNDPKKPIVNVKLSGQAPPPKIDVSPKSLNFGRLPAGNSSPPKMLTIKNTGISDLIVSSITITGANADEFTQSNDCSVLMNGDECTVNVTFTPVSAGNKAATINILSNDPKNSVKNVSFFGTTNGSAATESSVAGIWMGGFSSSIFHQTYNVVGIITESGLARFAAPRAAAQYSGVVHVSGNNFSASAEAYSSEGIYIGIVNINGTFTPEGIMNGTYSGVGDHGTFSLAYNALYERPSSIAEIVGNWTDYSSDYYQTVTIDLNGHISGEPLPFGGCTYSGNAGIINSAYNVYNASLTISNCGVKDGFYNGLATLTDTDTNKDTILAIVSNATHSFIVELRRD